MKETTAFQNGGSQAVRIPKEMRLESEKVLMEKVGNILVIIDGNDPWESVRLAQTLADGKFMLEGRSVNPIIPREGLE